ncbi:MAG TPA: L,D-transpeptidase [Afifellaceae bacterium]|nr:L,D-transpeptidase [Afifellaceae bacterium]
MHRFLIAAALLAAGTSLVSPAAAQLSKEAVNGASFEEGRGVPTGEQNPLVFKLQALLDRAHVSPGVLDGYWGENVEKAISSFEEREGLEADGQLDAEVWKALGGDSADPVLIEYEITEQDLEAPFVEIPSDWRQMAEMEWLGYTRPAELLAETFHMDVEVLEALNEGADFGTAGTTIIVAAVREAEPSGKVTRIEADKAAAQVRGYDAEDNLLVAYPATIGSEENPSPSGTVEVTAVAINPTYHYRPDENFQVGDIDEPLVLPPGPNNPVGTVWIDLSKDTYGIHGTPEPAQIDKESSHGCVRLTNWDAEELAGLVEVGASVEFVE